MALCRAPAPSVDDQSSAARPSPIIASQRRVFEIEMCICALLPEPTETTGQAPQFKPKKQFERLRDSASLVSTSPSCYAFSGRPHADWIREVDWRTEIRRDEPVRTRDDHRFRPCVEQGARPDGAFAAGAGGLHCHRRSHHPGKKTTESRIAGSDLFGRTCGGAAYGLDQAGNALSSPRPTRRRGRKTRHPAQRGQVLLRRRHAQENGGAFVAL